MTEISALCSIYHKTLPSDLIATLNSISSQTVRPCEVIAILDGPVDHRISSIINQFKKDLKIKTLSFDQNRGLGWALRDGVNACSGELIARFDTDDQYPCSRFEDQLNFLNNNREISVVGGYLEEVYSIDKKIQKKTRLLPCHNDEIREFAIRRNPLNHQTVMMRKADVLEAGNYQHSSGFEDYFLWARMLLKEFRFANIPKILASTSVSEDYFIRRGGGSYIAAESRFARELRHIGFLTASQMVTFVAARLPFRIFPKKLRMKCYLMLLR